MRDPRKAVFIAAGRRVALANRYAIPAVYPFREDVLAGGLVSYGASNRDAFRMVGNFVGRILNGNKPSDLPVEQVTKLEMAVNLPPKHLQFSATAGSC